MLLVIAMDKYTALTPEVLHILRAKGTEYPFTGNYLAPKTLGSYLCRGCGLALFRGNNQFHSGCGWPSFDAEIAGAVKRQCDKDGCRTEILCNRCGGHLGHVFLGEQLTSANTRHCVNSLAIEFVADSQVFDTEEIILAAGCFWGVEHLVRQLPGVLLTEVGYIGGEVTHPSYNDVCRKTTGHLEAVRVIFDPTRLALLDLLKAFFEIHDFTQINGQGPDLGPQYLSAIFYFNQQQFNCAQFLREQLTQRGYRVATQLYPVTTFWPAEAYHQNYYQKTGHQPYCHIRRPIF